MIKKFKEKKKVVTQDDDDDLDTISRRPKVKVDDDGDASPGRFKNWYKRTSNHQKSSPRAKEQK